MATITYEKQLLKTYKFIAGIDEAGRGPLAGPVVVAAVVLKNPIKRLHYINDSKLLKETLREKLYDRIIDSCESYAIEEADHLEIDAYNILHATWMAMHRVHEKLELKPDHTIIDGRFPKKFKFSHETVIGGDEKHYAIAAASILAKVYRDRLMKEYAEQYPEYGFESHKGYGTKKHWIALESHGLCPIHRRSFFKNTTLRHLIGEEGREQISLDL